MNEEVKMFMDEAKELMQNAIVHLENELAKIRAGKANPKILNDSSGRLLWITHSIVTSSQHYST